MRCWLNLRHTIGERADAFREGLQSIGCEIRSGVTFAPGSDDILVTWNRIGEGAGAARAFESAGRPVLVAENAAWGNEFAGDTWVTLARNWHNRAGCFPVGGPERWDSLGVSMAPWRASGETVVLPQRGIGAEGMPRGWTAPGRVRRHPGRGDAIPLEDDLAKAGKVITWGSGAAIKALIWGIPVEAHMPDWIGAQNNTDASRLEMFRRLAWAQWRISEIRSGEAFRWLLPSPA